MCLSGWATVGSSTRIARRLHDQHQLLTVTRSSHNHPSASIGSRAPPIIIITRALPAFRFETHSKADLRQKGGKYIEILIVLEGNRVWDIFSFFVGDRSPAT